MGFSFRKSVKIGPVRLNVSKSGVGMSVGVPGARIGINSKGKVYGSAGVKGLTYRTQLSPTAKRKKTAADKVENITETEAIPLGCENKDRQGEANAGGVVGVLLMMLSFVVLFVNTDVGLVGLALGFFVLLVSVVVKRQSTLKRLRQQIIQNEQLSEDEQVDLLAQYCHWKSLSGEAARRVMTELLEERAEFLGKTEGAEK